MGDKVKPTKTAKDAIKKLLELDKAAEKRVKKAGK